MGGGEKSGPHDEYEVLRVLLMIALRRQPADMQALVGAAEALSQMAASQDRISPKRQEQFAENLRRILARFPDLPFTPGGDEPAER